MRETPFFVRNAPAPPNNATNPATMWRLSVSESSVSMAVTTYSLANRAYPTVTGSA
jgi:hypothetical protein